MMSPRLKLAVGLAFAAAWVPDPAGGQMAEDSSGQEGLNPDLSSRVAEALKETAQPPRRPAAPPPEPRAILESANDDTVIKLEPVEVDAPKDFTVDFDRPEKILEPKALGERLKKTHLSRLDRGLNRWTIPLFGIAAEDRAARIAQEKRMLAFAEQINGLANRMEDMDPEGARDLRRELYRMQTGF